MSLREKRLFGMHAPHPRPFRDRHDAGVHLAATLHAYRGARPLVLGVPRGGVPVAYEIAKRLDGDLDVLVARKVVDPKRSELTLGAITADGGRRMNPKVRAYSELSDDALALITEEQRVAAAAEESRYRSGSPAFDPAGRIVILVDDALATGATLGAALSSLRQRGVDQLMVAVPVGSPEACDALTREVDGFICLHRPHPFVAASDSYDSFAPVESEEVEQLLRHQRERRTGAGPRV